MTSDAKTVKEYLEQVAPDKKEAIKKLYQVIKKNIPKGFQEAISYGMIGWVVPHKRYPAGYHCTPELPLPFVNIAAQKNFIAVYHMCLYGDPVLYKWFTTEYAKKVKTKLDMGKSCIRFKKPAEIPFELIGELMQKVSMEDWIARYEEKFLKSNKKA